MRADAEERTGNRLRKIYAITEREQKAFLELLCQALTSPPHSLKSEFSLGLIGFSDNALPPEERVRLLLQNIKKLEQNRELWKIGQEVKGRFHPALKALFANDLELIERDLCFLRELLENNEKSVGQTAIPGRAKANHFLLRTTGTNHGNPFIKTKTRPAPNFYQLMFFRGMRLKAKHSPCDRKYWEERGWLTQNYYLKGSVNPVTLLLANIPEGMMGLRYRKIVRSKKDARNG